MSTRSSIRLEIEPIRSLAFGSIGAAYAAVGTGVTEVIHMFIIQNYTDKQLMFSFNGTNDHITLASNTSIVIDVASNKAINRDYFLGDGKRLYVKHMGSAPTSGSVYFSVFYSE